MLAIDEALNDAHDGLDRGVDSMQFHTRRQILASAASVATSLTLPSFTFPALSRAASPTTRLLATTRVIEVRGRAATVFGLLQPDGTHGLVTEVGQRFRVRLENHLQEETLIHWHGLLPPWQQDGVPDLSQPPLVPGKAYDYDFPLARSGTYWMHSHYGLQEQRLLAAPLIVRDPAETREDVQEVVVLFHDFTFRDPQDILADLVASGHGRGGHAAGHPSGAHAGAMHGHPAGNRAGGTGAHHGGAHRPMAHLHDVEFDAFLANDRTLADPAVFFVERRGRVRLRLINAAAATNFWLDLDGLAGRLIAVDGQPILPLVGRRFPFAIAQRLDLLLELPASEGAWPVFAVREGDRARTGFVLKTRQGRVTRLAEMAAEPFPPLGLALERELRAAQPLPSRPADRHHHLLLDEGPGYSWLLSNAHGEPLPLVVRAGERVELTLQNRSSMAHPMHLHGHQVQVVAIDGVRFAGAVRDTVLVPQNSRVTIAFEANNPGKWALHCHHLYHMVRGMMTTLEYEA